MTEFYSWYPYVWENGKGLPDISILPELAKALSVSVSELLTGELAQNMNRNCNMTKALLYCCPVCGNVILSAGAGSFSCCGITLPPLEAEESADHAIKLQSIDGELYVSLKHPMEKGHYISFFAYVTADGAEVRKLYPEQDAEARFSRKGGGIIYAYCNRHGLQKLKL